MKKSIREAAPKGMTAEEKEAQILAAQAPAEAGQVNDDDVFNPEAKVINLGDRKYFLKPLKLSEMRLLLKLSKLKLAPGEFDETQIDLIIDCISQLLKEPDKNFIEENLDSYTLARIFKDVQDLNYKGVPTPSRADRRAAGN